MVDYDEQLERALDETPDIEESGDRFDVPDPNVRQEGNATVYENFQATLNRLGRDEEHVLKFVQNELGTSAQIDEKGRARLTGSFSAERIENTIEKYAEQFVRCPECGLPDTRLEREHGALILRCEACGARAATSG
jgi:translation initiation factor 2 subunit 2